MSVLGKGGFGTAFLARDIDSPTKRKCVVKLFQPPVTLTPKQMATAQRLFATEAEVLERFGIQHPQIPNLYAYFPILITNPLTNQTEELFYLVQEFIDGEDLERILNRDGAFSEADVLDVLREMLSVLDFVHGNGAIHRDVKPSNIMKGRNGKLYLLDFGAVKEVATPQATGPSATAIGQGPSASSNKRKPTTICSPEYAPPEQIWSGTVGSTSDLYALAATCVILLTNKESSELRDSSTNQWLWHSHTNVSEALASMLDKMLMPSPSDRFPSARATLSALNASSGMTGSSAALPTAPQYASSIGGSAKPPSKPAPVPASAPAPLVAKTPQPANIAATQHPSTPRSLLSFLGSAAFMGTEGSLLAIAVFSLLEITLFGGGVWLGILAALILLQAKRTIEGWDFLIIAVVTFAAVAFVPPLNTVLDGPVLLIAVISVMAGGAMVLIAAFFRLIFRILSGVM